MDSIPLELHTPTPSEVLDFGRIFQHWPLSVLKPKTPEEISLLLKYISSSPSCDNLTVAARGAGHSTHGQSQALDGIIIDMASLPISIKIGKIHSTSDLSDHFYVDVTGGVLWVDVLEKTLKQGLAPRSWTDYLFLSVGGTLSVGGISGQTFKYGPQICNVLEMDVVTGRGDFVTCSKEKNSELFNGVLGGLGQFGIIVRARIILEIAPKMVKCTTVSYKDFSRFTRDQELLISMKEVDYLEGYIKRGDSTESLDQINFSHLSLDTVIHLGRMAVYYTIEIAIYCNGDKDVQQTLDQILSRLSFSSVVHSIDVSYFDFLNRVRHEEQNLRQNGLWEVPHPWLNIFVPRFQINKFKDLVLEIISSILTKGPILIYPILRHKWNPKMSAVLPRNDIGEDILYVIGLLRSAVPLSCLQTLLEQNQRIIDDTTTSTEGGVRSDEKSNVKDALNWLEGGGMGAKQYMPYCRDENEWKVHFGEEWDRFQALKSKFDPLNILSPGQRIFKRRSDQLLFNTS